MTTLLGYNFIINVTTKIVSFNNSNVIQKFSDGKTLDQIAVETNLSKGTGIQLGQALEG